MYHQNNRRVNFSDKPFYGFMLLMVKIVEILQIFFKKMEFFFKKNESY